MCCGYGYNNSVGIGNVGAVCHSQGYLNDLWMYDGDWRPIRETTSAVAIYGVKGLPSSANQPGWDSFF